VIVSSEHCQPALLFIAADSFKNRAAVADDVREDVNFRVIPSNQAAIVPDFLRRYEHVEIIASAQTADVLETVGFT